MSDEKRYWKSLEERASSADFMAAAQDEFGAPIEGAGQKGFNRRNFLRAAGFSAATLMAGCSRAPVDQAIPFLVKPEESLPGKALYYSSLCAGCSSGCGVIAKNRDGRPIKLEGNPAHEVSRGGLCAIGQASLLGLYDSLRLQDPLIGGGKVSWQEMDLRIAVELDHVRAADAPVRFLTTTINSPTLLAAINRFLAQFKDARHVVYDPISCSAILDAHLRTHGTRVLPRYRFDRADVIAGFDADFLGTWISPVEFAAGWRSRRQVDASPAHVAWHAQFESRFSLTGGKADRRFRIAPGESGAALSQLAARVARHAGLAIDFGPLDQAPELNAVLDELADRLWAARGHSLVVSGSQNVAEQVLCNLVNHDLGSYGQTVDIERPSYQRAGNDQELAGLIAEAQSGKVGALFLLGANPVYELPGGAAIAAAIARIPLLVSFAPRLDETSSLARYVAPDRDAYESWRDSEALAGIVSIGQPLVRPIGNARAVLETLDAWTEGAERPRPQTAYELIRAHWQAAVFPRRMGAEQSFDTFWDGAVRDGIANVRPAAVPTRAFDRAAVAPVGKSGLVAGGLTLVCYPKAAIGDGRHSYNAWLQELPDPVSKVAWDNYACVSPATAVRLGINGGDVVRLTAAAATIELPAYIQPGQHDSVVAVALGYGSKATERFAKTGKHWFGGETDARDGRVGKNAAPLLRFAAGSLCYHNAVSISKTGTRYELACTQGHQTLAVPQRLSAGQNSLRPIIQETSLEELRAPSAAPTAAGREPTEDLWPDDHRPTGHRWGMVVDLDACNGCSACVVACQVENNIAVVGRDEVRRRRQMHWLRIDRYYADAAGTPAPPPGPDDLPAGDVEVAYQPMMCAQCDNAACETVCPVLATVHSAEGLNQQIYNRCVGTRYCANNCPYKVRRFNWFEYPREDRRQNLVLNPDVTVRSRGVMEKCTFCVQRIQEAKISALQRGQPVADGAIQPACAQSCPARAITFGDLNDPNSAVSTLMKNPRRYKVLEELNTRPAVGYLKVVRSAAGQRGEESHG